MPKSNNPSRNITCDKAMSPLREGFSFPFPAKEQRPIPRKRGARRSCGQAVGWA